MCRELETMCHMNVLRNNFCFETKAIKVNSDLFYNWRRKKGNHIFRPTLQWVTDPNDKANVKSAGWFHINEII